MPMNDPIQELKRLLSPEDLPVVVSALRFDPLVWKQLDDPEIFHRAVEVAGSQPDLWNPAVLALIALEQDTPIDSLRSVPLKPLSADLRQQAVGAYEAMLRDPKPPADLQKAGLLALALRERRRLTDSWQGLLSEIQGTASIGKGLALDFWMAPLACLYGMASDPVYLLSALISTGSSADLAAQARLILHALLSNPVSASEQVRILTALLSSQPADVQMAVLSALKDQAAPDVVNQLAAILNRSKGIADLIARSSGKTEKAAGGSDPLARSISFQELADRQALAHFFLTSNRLGELPNLLESTKSALRRYQAEIALLEAQAAARQDDHEAAIRSMQQAIDFVPSSTKARLELADEYLRLGRCEEASAVLPSESGDPRSLLARSLIAASEEKIPQARDYAQTAVKNAGALSRDARHQLVDQLNRLGLYAEAGQVASAAAGHFPADRQFFDQLTRAQIGSQNVQEAVKTAQLAAVLSPDDPAVHRLAADAYEAASDWDHCLGERRQVIALSPAPKMADFHAHAASALQANRPEEAIQVCQQVLRQAPEDGLAHTYLGEAALKNRDLQMAMDEFAQATLLLPDQSQAWLGLSQAYKTAGERQKSIETLRSAAQAAPHNPEILLALGQACLEEGSPTEALPALRRAAAIAPHSPELSLQLGKTLYNLGRLAEARQVLDRSRNYWPNHPGLALAMGKTQLGLGEIASALQALEIALQGSPTDPEPYMLYAQSILDLSRATPPIGFPTAQKPTTVDISLARKALAKSLELDPDNFEARVLMGEAQAAGGMLEDALNTYLELSEMDQARDPRWNSRIHLGMGRVALSLGQMETAIAALQEAVQANPEDLEINQVLAEAYQAAHLPEEASVQARTALGMAPHNVENLIWYAGMSLQMKEELEAVNILQHAIDVAPQRADLRLTLARLQMQLKDNPSARKTLKEILSVEQTSAEEMSQAAGLFSELGETPLAIASLEKSIALSAQPSAELWAKLAKLQDEAGDPTAALESVQTALEIRPFDAGLHYLHGELLAGQGRSQAALSCFEQSLDLVEKTADAKWVHQPQGLRPEPLKLRIAGFLRDTGDTRAALARSREVVVSNPKSVDARLLAADLASSLLDHDLALELASLPDETMPEAAPTGEAKTIDVDPLAQAKLLTLRAEMHMERNANEAAEELLSRAHDLSPENPRVLANQARLLARKGEFLTGMDLLENALAHLHSDPESDQPAADPTLPIAEAALELHQWQTALPLYAQVIRAHPNDARSHFSHARALVTAAGYQPAYKSLGAVRHAPGTQPGLEADFQAFEREIQAAARLASSPEIGRLYQRGLESFHPSQHSFSPEDFGPFDQPIASTEADDQPAEEAAAAKSLPQQLDDLFQHSLQQKEAEPQMAFAAAQALVSQKPGHPLYEALYAEAARKNNDPVSAYTAIQSALNTWPDEPYWQVFAAETADECGASIEALEHWKQACALEPENPAFTCALGKAYLKTGSSAEAVQVLEQATSMDPSDPSAWISLAQAHRAGRSYSDAIAAAEKAIRLSPGDIVAIVASGEIALEARQFDLARQRAGDILAIQPNHPKAVLLLAKSEASQGRPAQALQALEEALPTLTQPFEVLLERGRLIRKLRGLPPALEAFRSLAQQYPDEPDGLAEYAMVLAEAGQKAAAEKTAQSALQLKPNHADLHLLLGCIQHSAGQLDQAIYHLSEAARLAPDDVEVYLELGKTYSDRREQTQALKVYQQAFAIAPEDYRAYYQAGLALKDCKDYVMAETMLRRAAEVAPDDLNVRRQLAAIIAINLVHNPQEAPTIK
jgi:tetratricopeptide (TPR) repeat protein